MGVRAGRLIRLLIAAALTGYVLWRSDPRAVLQVMSRADLGFIGIAILLVLIDRALNAYRWLVLLCAIEPRHRPPLGAVMRIFFVSTFVGTFLPASVGGDAVRAYSLARLRVSSAAAVASVFMDRMMGVLSILLLALGGVLLARGLASQPLVVAGLAFTGGACLIVAWLVFSDRAAQYARRAIDRLPWSRPRVIAARLSEALQRYATHHWPLAGVLLCSLAVQVLRVVQGYYLGRSLGLSAPLLVYFALIPLILLVMLLPVTINGIGTSQAAFVWFFGAFGVARPDAFALSVLFVALGIVGNLPGAFLYAIDGWSSSAHALNTQDAARITRE